MGQQEQQLSGPDLSQGIAADLLADGDMLAGHVSGEAALLVRHGDEFFAVGATCTHYGAPLSDALLVGETVRCPWHHACFDLRTGDPLRAPALRPLTRWQVERRGDFVVVTSKLESPDPELGGAASPPRHVRRGHPESVVIIGAGAAGSAAAETLRREGFAGRITLVDSDPDAPYDRPNLSKDYLAGTAPEEWIPLRPPDFYRDHGIDLKRGVLAVRIDPGARQVTVSNGSTLSYDALLVATGAEPVHLPTPLYAGRRIHYLRTLADSRAIIAAAEKAQRAVVLGASFIGLEVAASLRARGVEVHVVAPEAHPLERVMGREIGEFLRGLHEERGVAFHMGRTASSIDDKAVTLGSGEILPADLVVAGVGVRLDPELTSHAGLAWGGGLHVDEYLETSATGIFAAGDIAAWPDSRSGERVRVEHWVVAQRQGQTAARNMLGAAERFDAVPFFWSNHYDVSIGYVGHAERWDHADLSGSLAARDATVTFRRGESVLAVATIGRDREGLEAELALERSSRKALAATTGASPHA
jgi:NADPH-dependent 2,4-dienoyl-CoA reductase/sulfur reductase-like enzyme/nitrite reductase/ring-hydroxylating ferredoxin subunit